MATAPVPHDYVGGCTLLDAGYCARVNGSRIAQTMHQAGLSTRESRGATGSVSMSLWMRIYAINHRNCRNLPHWRSAIDCLGNKTDCNTPWHTSRLAGLFIIDMWRHEAPPKRFNAGNDISAARSAAEYLWCIDIWRREAPPKN